MEDVEVDVGFKVDVGFCFSNFMVVGVFFGDYLMYMFVMVGFVVSLYMLWFNYDSGMQ